ncbi:MAG: DUF424 domain-containing protein [Nitrososphaerales archaeon]
MKNLFAVRTINYHGTIMVNICDHELVGTKVKDGELEIKIAKDYFGQQVAGEEEVSNLLASCSVANLVGKRIVNKALSMKLASNLSVRTISDVPFLMIFKFQHAY